MALCLGDLGELMNPFLEQFPPFPRPSNVEWGMSGNGWRSLGPRGINLAYLVRGQAGDLLTTWVPRRQGAAFSIWLNKLHRNTCPAQRVKAAYGRMAEWYLATQAEEGRGRSLG